MKFSRSFILLSSILLLFITFPCSAKNFKCEAYQKCNPIDQWSKDSRETGPKTSITCNDACAAYSCVVNGAVIFGAGCYSDFKKTCTSSTNETSFDLTDFALTTGGKKQEKGNFVYVCTGVFENCATNGISLDVSMKGDNMFFDNNFLYGSTNNPDGCKSGSNGLMNQMNGFKLFGMIFLGVALAQFW